MTARVALVCLVLLTAGCSGPGPAETNTPTKSAETGQTTTAPTTTAPDKPVPPAAIDASNVTVERGGSVVVVVEASNVGEVHVEATEQDHVSLSYSNATFAPSPSYVVATLPPYWVWEPVESSVRGKVPVTVAADAPTGTYRFNVVAWNGTDHEHENGSTDTFVVTVVNATSD